MKINAKNLILDLLLAAEGLPLSAREAINACALFGIQESNVRVVLVRLSGEGLIESVERGLYRLSPLAHELADEVATWRTSEQRTRAWSGGYLAVHSAPLGRTDRKALRRRQRALDMTGFRELDRGLYVRPDNLEEDIDGIRKRLTTLGLEAEAAVFRVTAFDADRQARLQVLWDGKALNAAYRKLGTQLEQWMARAATLEPEVAAREAFVLGSKAIRQIVFDPLLPDPIVDTGLRRAFVGTVRRYDAYGQQIWRTLRALPAVTSPAPPPASSSPR